MYSLFKDILVEMRIRQYTKNIFVFAALLFSGQMLDTKLFLHAVIAFAAFSLVSSSIYILNDIIDRKKDREHPVKCKRPIAAGKIPLAESICLSGGVFVTGIMLGLVITKSLLYILLTYAAINIAYSLYLKHMVIIDVMTIAAGFVLRALAGVAATGVGTTSWFILCIFMLALFLGLAKRYGELVAQTEGNGKTRRVLNYYSLELVRTLSIIVTAIMLTSYALFAQSSDSLSDFPLMLLTLPIVLYGVFRYWYLVLVQGKGEQPEEILLNDRGILFTVIVYILAIMFARDLGGIW